MGETTPDADAIEAADDEVRDASVDAPGRRAGDRREGEAAASSPTSTARTTSTSRPATSSTTPATATRGSSRPRPGSSARCSRSPASTARSPAIRLAEKLIKLAPKSIDKAFFSTGGSEANEFALKLARQYRKKPDVAYLENGYHGLTLGSLEVTASEKYRESAGKPLGTDNYAIPTAYCYRCKFGPHAQCKVECLDGVDAIFDAHPNTAAIIAEPIQAVGGLAPPQKWWDRLDAIRAQARHPADRRRDPDRPRPHRQDVRDRPLRARARDHDRRQGPVGRRRLAAA